MGHHVADGPGVLPGIVPLSGSPDGHSPAITEDEVEADGEMSERCGGRLRSRGPPVKQEDDYDDDMLEGIDHKLVAGARDLISRQHMQQSFNANAAVSLEQVGRVRVCFWCAFSFPGALFLSRRLRIFSDACV